MNRLTKVPCDSSLVAMDISDRVSLEVHEGLEIHVTDYSQLPIEAVYQVMHLSIRRITIQPKNSVLLLEIAHHIRLDDTSLRRLEAYIADTKPYVKKIAVTGGPTAVLAQKFTSIEYPIAYFDSKKEAIAFLIEEGRRGHQAVG